LEKNAEKVVTVGMYGSNHALATAFAARRFGLQCRLILGPQPVTEDVKNKLLAFHALGAELSYHGNFFTMVPEMFKSRISRDYYIPPGGSYPVGSMGYINAFFELLEQLDIKDLPSEIFVPAGSGGTLAGLIVGSWLSGHSDKIKFHAVQVTSPILFSERKLWKEVRQLSQYVLARLSDSEKRKLPNQDLPGKNKINLCYVTSYFPPPLW